MNQLHVKVVGKTSEAEDIASFELASIDGAPLPPFSAGAHIDVEIGDGLVRQYSLCNRPNETHRYVIAVLRDANSRGGSLAMHDHIAPGRELVISEPKNHFPLVPAQRSLLFAGGIGVTPLLAMAEVLAQTGQDFELHYSARSPERTAFRQRIAQSAFAGRVQFHFDCGSDDQKLDLARLLARPDPGIHLYVCGPSGYIAHVLDGARALGWLDAQLHVEYFGAAAVDPGGDRAFEVRLAGSGQTFTIPAGQTVVAVLAEHGVDIPVSCEQGVCGTCLTRVLEGTPDHRDLYMTDEEHAANDQFTPCCSRAKSALLVLDL